MKLNELVELTISNLAKFMNGEEEARKVVHEICADLNIDADSDDAEMTQQIQLLDALIERGGKPALVGRSLKIKAALSQI